MIYVSISHSASQGAFSKLQILEGLILLINEPNTWTKIFRWGDFHDCQLKINMNNHRFEILYSFI